MSVGHSPIPNPDAKSFWWWHCSRLILVCIAFGPDAIHAKLHQILFIAMLSLLVQLFCAETAALQVHPPQEVNIQSSAGHQHPSV